VGELTAATTSKNTTPTTFGSISGFALPSVIHNNQPSYRLPIFESSATALCSTTGKQQKHEHRTFSTGLTQLLTGPSAFANGKKGCPSQGFPHFIVFQMPSDMQGGRGSVLVG
jgi:hypothetical protein